MKKIFLSFFVLFALLSFSQSLFAALGPLPKEVFTDETFVYELSVIDKEYVAGDEVSGTFTILNASDGYLDKVQYLIYVAGNIDSNFNHNPFGKTYSPIFGLEAKTPIKIPFTYVLPKVLPEGEKELVVRSQHN